MTSTMRAYRLLQWQRPPELVEVPIPEPGPGEVLVKVAGNGLCHSDIGMTQLPAEIGTDIGWDMPFTLGHEIAGWVAVLGAGIDDRREGDPVALISPHFCGRCRQCLRGHESACAEGAAGRGYGRDGGLADYVVAGQVHDLVPLHDLDPATAGPLTDAGATSHHAVARVAPRLTSGDTTAVVVGAGGLGGFAVQILRAITPARVIAVDANPARLDIARGLGATEVLQGVDDVTVGSLRDLTGGHGATAVLDFVGIDATIAAGLASVEPGGAYGLVGAGGGGFRRPWFGGLPRDVEIFTFQGSDVADVKAVISLAEAGHIRNDVDRFPLDRVADAYAAMEAGTLRGRAVVNP